MNYIPVVALKLLFQMFYVLDTVQTMQLLSQVSYVLDMVNPENYEHPLLATLMLNKHVWALALRIKLLVAKYEKL